MPSTTNPKFVIGSQPVVSVRFVSVGNVLTNPTTVTFITVDPLGTETTKASPDATIANPATGIWTYTLPGAAGVAIPGVWDVRAKGVGACVAAVEGTFEVQPSLVLTP